MPARPDEEHAGTDGFRNEEASRAYAAQPMATTLEVGQQGFPGPIAGQEQRPAGKPRRARLSPPGLSGGSRDDVPGIHHIKRPVIPDPFSQDRPMPADRE